MMAATMPSIRSWTCPWPASGCRQGPGRRQCWGHPVHRPPTALGRGLSLASRPITPPALQQWAPPRCDRGPPFRHNEPRIHLRHSMPKELALQRATMASSQAAPNAPKGGPEVTHSTTSRAVRVRTSADVFFLESEI